MITPRNIARHELVGLNGRVVESSDTSHVGIRGRVVEETACTLTFAVEDGGEKTVPKKYTVFEFDLPDAETVRVDGEAIEARPAERVTGV
ncbi:MAG: ribonuclease P protein subunit POP4 [Methanobacteriota archaeon]|jgi:ribonuclease P protein subunit POP4|uniref:Ribonuclease P protein component 1 n=1 Tax=Halorutilus salinus TaxID=2487751 RepID=A0A9Q4GGC6_9EURY|nr:ribonuclease P protein subunit [Halorutilus salinus]MCX2818557.1 ribonuclease P protein subunit [Halorutilus salinus]